MLPIILALGAAVLFGAATPASKLLLDGITPFQLAGLLYLGAASGVLPSALLRKKKVTFGSSLAEFRMKTNSDAT